jgi:hypothetical protein
VVTLVLLVDWLCARTAVTKKSFMPQMLRMAANGDGDIPSEITQGIYAPILPWSQCVDGGIRRGAVSGFDLCGGPSLTLQCRTMNVDM